MSIHSGSLPLERVQTPSLKETEGVQNSRVSAFDLDHQFVEAFQALNIDQAKELVMQGANPDQKIDLNFKIILEFLKVNLFGGQAQNPKTDWDAILTQLEAEGNLEGLVNDFFGGQSSPSALYLSLILRNEDLALALIENHAQLALEVKGPDDMIYSVNALQMASAANLAGVVKHLLQNTSMGIHLAEKEGDISPLEIALMNGAYDVFKVMVENRRNEVMKLLIEKDELRQVMTDSLDPNVAEYRQLLIDHGFPIQHPEPQPVSE